MGRDILPKQHVDGLCRNHDDDRAGYRSIAAQYLLIWTTADPKRWKLFAKSLRRGISGLRNFLQIIDHLDGMNLVVNGPLKEAPIRRARCAPLLVLSAVEDSTPHCHCHAQAVATFQPPAPTLVDGLCTLFGCIEASLQSEKFEMSIARCCVGVAGIHPKEGQLFTICTAHTLSRNHSNRLMARNHL